MKAGRIISGLCVITFAVSLHVAPLAQASSWKGDFPTHGLAVEARQLEQGKALVQVKVNLDDVQGLVLKGATTGRDLVSLRIHSPLRETADLSPLAKVMVDAESLRGSFGQILEYDLGQERGLAASIQFLDGSSREMIFATTGKGDFRVAVMMAGENCFTIYADCSGPCGQFQGECCVGEHEPLKVCIDCVQCVITCTDCEIPPTP
jgi:hypothetical protein